MKSGRGPETGPLETEVATTTSGSSRELGVATTVMVQVPLPVPPLGGTPGPPLGGAVGVLFDEQPPRLVASSRAAATVRGFQLFGFFMAVALSVRS